MEIRKVTVKMSEWLRGGLFKTKETSVLVSGTTGKMCCLGFVGKALGGLTKVDMEDVKIPSLVTHITSKFPNSLVNKKYNGLLGCTDICYTLMKINDDGRISDKMRMYRLNRLKNQSGIEFVFVP